MLVKCYDDAELREWYSVNSSNKVITTDLMEWRRETGLVLKTRQNLYQRRYNVGGTVLRMSSVKEHQSLLKNQANGEGVAMFAKIMIELATQMNFRLRFVSSEDAYGVLNSSNNKWTGILGRLQSGEVDIATSEITMTKERMDAFDFACPLIITRAKLFIREPGGADVQWNSYLKAFSTSIWVSLIILIILSAILLTYMKTKIAKIRCLKNYLVENHLYVWGIYCQQGLSEFPDSSSLRIAYVSIFFSAVVLSAIYSASIISYLTIFTPSLPFDTLASYVGDGTYKLIVVRHSAEHEMFATSHNHELKRMSKLMKRDKDLPVTDIQALEQVCHERVAYYSTDAMRDKMGDMIPCNLKGISTGRIENLAFTLTKNNPFTEFINYHILRFQDNGIMQRMRRMYYKKLNKPTKDYDAVGLWGIAPLITILILGTILSVLMLFIEKLYHNMSSQLDDDGDNDSSSTAKSQNLRDSLTWRRRRKSTRSVHSCCHC
ncbi:glutamate receptor ionotropic, NMDA 1-like [Nasonia vitripennis]|uniref:Uncharacterized protein n=1 Tax=Nasonia vitripennis TaxID=7425 RepID=A0A7M7ISD6_NASVI|nr:glutamate receptor ionotropic, NMDA 1-like [Nasonia vitripennis]